ncbi:Fic family protein [Burkholderia glumae]|uniref:Fic family protein n=2 Tax=Burkholderia glumae TaxID=337 RepID=UPI00214FA206|nr:Fic family protein [Burkholderia glumae]
MFQGAAPVGNHTPPPEYRVQALMDDFVNFVNRNLESADPVALAAYVLWRFNWIHPFINGNGRTARAACYFVLCLKAGGWLSGRTILPELIRRERARYEAGLRHADENNGDVSVLHALLSELLLEQLADNIAPAGSEQIVVPKAPDAADDGAAAIAPAP